MLRVYRGIEQIGPECSPCAVCIGNFDGVHAGHRRILERAVKLGHERGWIPSVLTFDPHPTKVVAPNRAPLLLHTTEEKIDLLRETGIEQVFVLPFDREFSQRSPDDFVQHVLVESLGAAAVLVGDNFRFGAKQAGNVDTLRELGAKFGFYTEVVGGVKVRGYAVSSSEIRRLLQEGNVSQAGRLLGRPYWVQGVVVTGHGVGSKQTVPTLNLRTEAEILPAHGVYITRTHDLASRTWPSITNIGRRPTFGGDQVTVETYLLTQLEGETPESIRIEFLRRVRPERKFESPAALKEQILRDVQRAQSYFRRCASWTKPYGYTEI